MLEKQDIFPAACQALASVTGLQVISHGPAQPAQAAWAVSLKGNGKDPEVSGQGRDFPLEVKKQLTSAGISQMALQSQNEGRRVILVAPYISAPQAEKLRALDIPFFDTAGNAYFNEPGLFVFVTGRKAPATTEKPARIFGPAGLKLLFALLTQPQLLRRDYRTMLRASGIASTSTVGAVLDDLARRGYLARKGKDGTGGRNLRRREELLRRWVEAYGETLRPRLITARFTPKHRNDAWWREVNLSSYPAQWGGEVAAERLTNYLKPEIITIYANSALPQLQARYGLQRDPRGQVEILRKFWTDDDEQETVPPLLVYADLMDSADERNLETAQLIYERYLA